MSYVNSNLLKGESVLHTGRVHWWAWGKGAALIIIGIAMANTEAQGLGVFAFMLGVVLAIKGAIAVATTELAITNRRVIAKFGFIRRSTVELLHNKVEGLNVNQSIFGRLLGFGTVLVNGTGASKTPIPHITKPLEFRRAALETIETAAERPQQSAETA